MAKNELSPGWLHDADSMFRGIGDLYPNTGVEQRSYKKLGYSDRVFDTLARILQVHGPCCAVLPLIDHSVSPDAGTPIKNLYFSFNSNITNKDTTRLLDNVKATIIEVLTNPTPTTEDKIFHLVANFISNNNKCYDFKRSAITFIDDTVNILKSKQAVGIELNKQQQGYLKDSELLKAAIKKIEFKDTQDKNECVKVYIELINYSKIFLKDSPINITDEFVSSTKAETIKSNLFKVYRIYLDSKKLVELLPKYYQLELTEDFFQLIENPRAAHAETNLVDQIETVSKGQILKSTKQHIGISKLSCQICYDTLTEIGLVDNVLGCHGLTSVNGWGLPLFFSTKDGVKYLLTQLIPKIVHTLSTATPINLHPLRQEIDLSDDETEFQNISGSFYENIHEVAVLGELYGIQYDSTNAD